MVSDIEIMNRGIHCLLEKLGVVETERFIAVINRERFDYTKWQREWFDNMSSDEFNSAAVAYSKENPFCKKSKAEKITTPPTTSFLHRLIQSVKYSCFIDRLCRALAVNGYTQG